MFKAVFSFILLIVSLPLAFSQTNNPAYIERDSYDTFGVNQKSFSFLSADYFPWGLCFSYYGDFNEKERAWTREAMQIWNAEYKNYVYNRWGTVNMVGIPTSPLFVESCNKDKHNIIYLKKEVLAWYTVAYYKEWDYWYDAWQYHGVLGINKNKTFNRIRFINVTTHELGHALALPHDRELSTIMRANGFYCEVDDEKGVKKICKPRSYDFEIFLVPYNPKRAMTLEEYKMEQKRQEEERYLDNLCMHLGGRRRGICY